MIGPCVDVLRKLARHFNHDLGAAQGRKHTTPDLSKDINTLIISLDEHNVYRLQSGRVLDKDDPPIADVIAVGLHNLVAGTKNPLADYNDAFARLQKRRCMKPVSEMMQELSDSVQKTSTRTLAGAIPIGPTATHRTSEPLHTTDNSSLEVRDDYVEGDTEFESELAQLMDELAGIETGEYSNNNDLPRLTADDVEFDMDMVGGGDFDGVDDFDSESGDDEGESDEEM